MHFPSIMLALVLGESATVEPFPAFALENFDGRSVSSSSLEGKTTIVVPTYAKCVFAYPMITLFLTELDSEHGSPARIQYVHVSVQPADDTADAIRDHFEEHGIDSERDRRWLFINGPEKEVFRFLVDTGVDVKRTRVRGGVVIEHTTRVFVVGPSGETLATFDSYFWDREEMRHALRYALEE